MDIILYSDGSARGNPSGPGGYGTRLEYTAPNGQVHVREFSQGYVRTTNNRMELMGVIVGLEALTKPCHVLVYTDSQYVCKAFNEGWLQNWVKNGWKTSGKKPVKNKELWIRLQAAMEPHWVEYNWVKGHAGHPGNERCDQLATTAADGDKLIIDEGLED